MEDHSSESKKDIFNKYLEQSGIIDEMNKMLIALYEEHDKPSNA